jgi:hypothetical protein
MVCPTVGEFEDGALMKVLRQSECGVFPAPTVVLSGELPITGLPLPSPLHRTRSGHLLRLWCGRHRNRWFVEPVPNDQGLQLGHFTQAAQPTLEHHHQGIDYVRRHRV